MLSLSQHVPNTVLNQLNSIGFHVETNSQFCSQFTTMLRKLAVEVSKYYESDIEKQLVSPECDRSREDLTSWANSTIKEILFGALGVYRQKILDYESLEEDTKVKCEDALGYFAWLIDQAKDSKEKIEKDRRQFKPSSKKFERKKASQAWTPYGVDVAWDAIKTIFNLKSRS